MVGRIPVMDVMPLVDLGRLPAKATAGEPLPVRASVFREGHDKLGAEVVLVAPDGSRRAPVRMVPEGDAPDRYVAWVTPDGEGAWTFEVHALVRPARHLGARRRAEDPRRRRRGADVHPGRPAARPGGRRPGPRRPRGRGRPRGGVGGPRHGAARGGPAGGPAVAGAGGSPVRPSAARAGHGRGSLPALRRPAEGPLQRLVRALPTVGGRDVRREDRDRGQRHVPHRRRAARRRGRDGLRRGLPAPDPPDRRGQPQGPEQHPRPGPRRPRLTRGRSAARTAATTRSIPTSGRWPTSTRSSRRPPRSGSRSRSTWPSSARPTIRG